MNGRTGPAWAWACPDCGAALSMAMRRVPAEPAAKGLPEEGRSDSGVPVWTPGAASAPIIETCPGCRRLFPLSGEAIGIVDLRPAGEAARLDAFLADYETVRRAEGRHLIRDDDLRALPWPGPATPQAWEWRIRSVSYEAMLDAVIRPMLAGASRRLRVLDLGAGQAWLSHRLAREGCDGLAVELSADAALGLGAARAYAAGDRMGDRMGDRSDAGQAAGSVTLAQADFRQLPLADGSADLAIFNASLHYAADLAATLAEARRVLAPGGSIVILDSPFYVDPAAGEAMNEARHDAYRQVHGFRSDRLGALGYLRTAQLRELGLGLGLAWRFLQPDFGLRWSVRRTWRRWRLGRESANFLLAIGQTESEAGA